MSKKVNKIDYRLDTKNIKKLPLAEIRAILRGADDLIMSGGRSLLAKILKGVYFKFFSESTDRVRSKSEVIIANLLAGHGIPYEYDKKLEYEDGKELYWEHLGMLGVESYDKRWLEKQDIYDKYFSGKHIVTYEGANITENTFDTINRLSSGFYG